MFCYDQLFVGCIVALVCDLTPTRICVLTRVPPHMLCVNPDTVHSTSTDTAFTYRELCVAASSASPTRSSKCAVFLSRSRSVCRANSGQARGTGNCLHLMARVDKLILLILCAKMNHSDQGCISIMDLWIMHNNNKLSESNVKIKSPYQYFKKAN